MIKVNITLTFSKITGAVIILFSFISGWVLHSQSLIEIGLGAGTALIGVKVLTQHKHIESREE